jgi:hypothetical protein
MKESVIRTVVPILVALLVRWGVQDALGIDDVLLQSLVTAAVTGLYYIGVRVLERARSSKWGWLLGYPSAPSYEV